MILLYWTYQSKPIMGRHVDFLELGAHAHFTYVRLHIVHFALVAWNTVVK